MSPRAATQAVPARVRCAIYTRQSVEERNRSDFGSLQAQREAGEKYISLFEEKHWEALATRYEDPGFSGGTLDRPGLKQLRADVAAGKIDAVIVYRSDRMSRSIRDFLELMEEFEGHDVSFVSVSEQFDTSTPGGRMHRNMLLTFAQYERELIAERTRDKIVAARRRGKFTGGLLPLGYDRHPDGGRLVVNEVEAKRVRQIFRLFLKDPSIIAVVQELNRRGWTLKQWTTKSGREYGGGAFDKFSLKRLLTNPLYIGRIRFEGQIYDGEHDAIVDQETWDRVQELLTAGAGGKRRRSTRSTALLAGILRCAACDSAMTPTYSQKGQVRYRYYLCVKAHRRGWDSCPSPSISATEIEQFLIDRIRAVGKDEEVIARTVEEAERQLSSRKTELQAEVKKLKKKLEGAHVEMRESLAAIPATTKSKSRNGRRETRIRDFEGRLLTAQGELVALRAQRIDADDLRSALIAFDPVWANLTTEERARVIHLLIERIDYDGPAGKIGITFSPAGVRTLAKETAK